MRSTIPRRGSRTPQRRQPRNRAMNYKQGSPAGCFGALAAFTVVIACATPPLRAQQPDAEGAPGCYLSSGIDAFNQGDLVLAERKFRGALKAFPGFLEAWEK